MTDEKTPILDPDRELPEPHDIKLEAGYSDELPSKNVKVTKRSFPMWIFPVIAFLVIILAGGIYLLNPQRTPTETVPPTELTDTPAMVPASTGMPIATSSSSSPDEQILQKIVQKYPATISWQPVKHATVTYREYDADYNLHEITIPVTQMAGSGKIDPETVCGNRCERDLLKSLHWQEDNNQAADGPTGSQWGYIQDSAGKKRILQLIYTNVTGEKAGPMATKCPCEVTYTISLSQLF